MQAFFRVTPPSVHQMVLQLERLGLLRRTPEQLARSSCSSPPRLCPALSRVSLVVHRIPERTYGQPY